MYRKIKNKITKAFKLNHFNYSYFIGERGVVIKSPDGESKLVKKEVIKGHFNPKKFQKILDKNEPWYLTDREIRKYIKDKLS